MAPRPLAELVDSSWLPALEPQATTIAQLGDFLRAENAAGRGYLPAGENVLRAFRTPLDAVRVLVVGQDPYPTPGHAVGLSFSVGPTVRPLPKSLDNIFREYSDDLGLPLSSSGDLSPLAERGVMLLNRVLTGDQAHRRLIGARAGSVLLSRRSLHSPSEKVRWLQFSGVGTRRTLPQRSGTYR